MGFRFIFFVAQRHLLARLRATSLILLGVGVGVFVMTVMQSMMFGLQGRILDTLLTITPSVLVRGRERGVVDEGRVYRSGAPAVESLAPTLYDQSRLKPMEKEKGIRGYRETIQRLAELPTVSAVAVWAQGRGLVRSGTRARAANVFGVDATDYDRVIEFKSKVVGDLDALSRRRDSVILGAMLAEELGAVIGSRVRLEGDAGQVQNLRVVGFFKSGMVVVDRTQAFVGLSTGQTLFNLSGAVSGFALRIPNPDSAPAVARQAEFTTGLESQSWQEANANFFNIMRQQNSTTFGTVGLTILVAGFGIANSLISAVLEKRRDIGILRALGLTARSIALIFVVEGVLIGIVGAVLGMLGAAWMIDLLSHTRMGGRGGFVVSDTFTMLKEPSVYITSTVFALAMSLISSLLPAARAARYDPVEIIRTAR